MQGLCSQLEICRPGDGIVLTCVFTRADSLAGAVGKLVKLLLLDANSPPAGGEAVAARVWW